MQAGAADALGSIVHERHAEAQLAGPEGGGIAAGAGAEDDDVEGLGVLGSLGTLGLPSESRGGTGRRPMVAKGPAGLPILGRAWTTCR